MASDPDDSSEFPPSRGLAQEDADVKMSPMHSLAAVGIGLQCTALPRPQHLWPDMWYFGSESGSGLCLPQVSSFPEMHEEVNKT